MAINRSKHHRWSIMLRVQSNKAIMVPMSEWRPQVVAIQRGDHGYRGVVQCKFCRKAQSSANYARHLRQVRKQNKKQIRIYTSHFKDRPQCQLNSEEPAITYSCPHCPAVLKNLRQHRRICKRTQHHWVICICIVIMNIWYCAMNFLLTEDCDDLSVIGSVRRGGVEEKDFL